MITQFNSYQKKLLSLLSIAPQTLENLSKKFNKPICEIQEDLNILIQHGIIIKHSKEKDSLQLGAPWDEINPQKIKEKFSLYDLDFIYFDSIDSTNIFLKQGSFNTKHTFCFAEMQEKGRGRLGREWNSPFGINIYLSLRTTLKCHISNLSGLSPVIGLSLCRSIEKAIEINKIKLKWPNDLYYDNQKLGGILIEIIKINPHSTELIIGIGLNVNSIPTNTAWTSLEQITNKITLREPLLIHIIDDLLLHLDDFTQKGFSNYQIKWNEKDYLKNKEITIFMGKESLQGYAQGLNNKGQLIFIDSKDVVHELEVGEVSLKPVG